MLFRKKLLLFKPESTYGVDANPTGSANAIHTRNLSIQTFQGNTVDLNYDKPRLGNSVSIYTGPYTKFSFECDLASSGTAGTPPPVGVLLRACGFQEKINATAVTGTATAGSTTTITLAAGASATDGAYVNFRIRITAGTGNSQGAVISNYVGATKVATVATPWTIPPDATSQYSIDAQVVYSPISGSFESATGYFYLDGELHKMLGARGSFVATFAKDALPIAKFDFTALRVAAASGANPTPDFSAWKQPLPVNKANTQTLSVHGYVANCESVNFDIGNKVVYRNVIGSESALITDRAPKGTLAIEKPAIGTKDFEALIAASATDALYVKHGVSAGETVLCRAEDVQLSNPQYSDSDGLVLMTMDHKPIPSDAGDDELRIFFL
ncbi:MAG: hypothetical protein QJR02_07235 [Sinobacteraceae bacterium]|nr:hypothetical protein [Nevskiaceae bacterium]